MFRFKHIVVGRLRARTLEGQSTEAMIGVNILNRMTELGMPLGVASVVGGIGTCWVLLWLIPPSLDLAVWARDAGIPGWSLMGPGLIQATLILLPAAFLLAPAPRPRAPRD
jgi:TRAP-type mannitol/chloroaromatic compound transport system permease large subunit